jgi:hypothetical protein
MKTMSKQIHKEIKDKCIHGQVVEDVQEEFDKFKTEEFKDDEESMIKEVYSKQSAVVAVRDTYTISTSLRTGETKSLSPDLTIAAGLSPDMVTVIGVSETRESGHIKASITLIVYTSHLEHGNCKRCGIGDRDEFSLEKTSKAKEFRVNMIELKSRSVIECTVEESSSQEELSQSRIRG